MLINQGVIFLFDIWPRLVIATKTGEGTHPQFSCLPGGSTIQVPTLVLAGEQDRLAPPKTPSY